MLMVHDRLIGCRNCDRQASSLAVRRLAEMPVIRLQCQVVTSYRRTQYDHDARIHH
jgi:hypothetical protein